MSYYVPPEKFDAHYKWLWTDLPDRFAPIATLIDNRELPALKVFFNDDTSLELKTFALRAFCLGIEHGYMEFLTYMKGLRWFSDIHTNLRLITMYFAARYGHEDIFIWAMKSNMPESMGQYHGARNLAWHVGYKLSKPTIILWMNEMDKAGFGYSRMVVNLGMMTRSPPIPFPRPMDKEPMASLAKWVKHFKNIESHRDGDSIDEFHTWCTNVGFQKADLREVFRTISSSSIDKQMHYARCMTNQSDMWIIRELMPFSFRDAECSWVFNFCALKNWNILRFSVHDWVAVLQATLRNHAHQPLEVLVDKLLTAGDADTAELAKRVLTLKLDYVMRRGTISCNTKTIYGQYLKTLGVKMVDSTSGDFYKNIVIGEPRGFTEAGITNWLADYEGC
jgi:hypothetical protein